MTCIAVTAQRSSLIAVDAQGRPLHPAILWQDSRCTALAQAMTEHDALVYGKTGLKISPVFSAIKMAWLRRERPAIWAATHKLLGVQDWVLFGLTGTFDRLIRRIPASIAARTRAPGDPLTPPPRREGEHPPPGPHPPEGAPECASTL